MRKQTQLGLFCLVVLSLLMVSVSGFTNVSNSLVNTTGNMSAVAYFGSGSYLTGIASADTIAGKFVNRTDWTTIDDYPGVCSEGSAVVQIADSLTCYPFLNKTYGDTLYEPLDSAYTKAETITRFVNRSSWVTIDNYPTGCTNQFVQDIGDTLTCATVDISGDTNFAVSGGLTLTDDTVDYPAQPTITKSNISDTGTLGFDWGDSEVADDITVTSYLLLSGGNVTGVLEADSLKVGADTRGYYSYFDDSGDVYVDGAITGNNQIMNWAPPYGANLILNEYSAEINITSVGSTTSLNATQQTICDTEDPFVAGHKDMFLTVISSTPSFADATGEIRTFINSTCIGISFGSAGSASIVDAVDMNYIVYPHPTFVVLDNGVVSMNIGEHEDAKFEIHIEEGGGFHGVYVEDTAGADQHQGITVDQDFQDYAGIVGLNLYSSSSTGLVNGSYTQSYLEINVDDVSDTQLEFIAATVVGHSVDNGNEVSLIHAIGDFDHLIHLGDSDTLNSAYSNDLNVTHNFTTVGDNEQVFINDNDWVYIGSETNFTHVGVDLGSGADANVRLDFYYCNSSGEWKEFGTEPLDTTNDFQISGNIVFTNPSDRGSCNTEVDETPFSDTRELAYIGLMRKRNSLVDIPVVNLITVSGATTLFELNPSMLKLAGSNGGPVTCSATYAGAYYYDSTGVQLMWCDGSSWQAFAMAGDVTVHNSLSGLQGGTSAEYYHLTSAQHGLVTGWVTSFPQPSIDWDNITSGTNPLQGDVDTLTSNSTALYANATLQGNLITTNINSITSLWSNASNQDGRIDAIEGDVDVLTGNVSNLQVNVLAINAGVGCAANELMNWTNGTYAECFTPGGGGTVTAVTGAAPITSTEGTTPEIGLTLAKDLVTTAPLTGAEDNIFPGADADVTLAITVLKDLVTTSPLTGGTDDVFTGADADITIAATILKDFVATAPLTGSEDNVLLGTDSDLTVGVTIAKDLVAGNGLTGGGDDELVGADGDVDLAVGAGDGIDVAADSVAVDVTDILAGSKGIVEIATNNIGLRQDCDDDQVLVADSSGNWVCADQGGADQPNIDTANITTSEGVMPVDLVLAANKDVVADEVNITTQMRIDGFILTDSVLTSDATIEIAASGDSTNKLQVSSDATDLTLATTDSSHLTIDPAGQLFIETGDVNFGPSNIDFNSDGNFDFFPFIGQFGGMKGIIGGNAEGTPNFVFVADDSSNIQLIVKNGSEASNPTDGGLIATGDIFLQPTGGDTLMTGDADVSGTFTAGTKTFKIDNPADPLNSFLYHQVVESPEGLLDYRGRGDTENIINYDNGRGWTYRNLPFNNTATIIDLPYWFDDLVVGNTSTANDFTAQITGIRGFCGDSYVNFKQLRNNRFMVVTEQPCKFSWLLQAVRQDPMYVETAKDVIVNKDNSTGLGDMRHRSDYVEYCSKRPDVAFCSSIPTTSTLITATTSTTLNDDLGGGTVA